MSFILELRRVRAQVFKINFESFHWKAEDLTLIRLDSHAVQVRNNLHIARPRRISLSSLSCARAPAPTSAG